MTSPAPLGGPAGPANAAAARELGRSLRHGHLWSLPDGTGLHAPPGTLTREEGTGRVCCHLCGRWYVSLAPHVRVHGYTAATYRSAVGLAATQALTSTALSRSISRRQTARYGNEPAVRDRFAPGQAMARDGRLGAAALAARRAEDGPEPAQRIALRQAALHRGRRTRAARRRDELDRRLAAAGADSLESFLREAYRVGASLDNLAAATGLGRARLRAALTAAGVAVRRPGVNTAAGKRSRAEAAERAAAHAVGAEDLRAWLVERRRDGWSISALARAAGRSTAWVRTRLPAAGP